MIKSYYLFLLFLLFNFTFVFSQTNGVSSFELPTKNSVKFNKFYINPTFSFVREEFSMISLFNKSQFSEFENAPSTISGNYSGKFQENNAFAIGGFQQNFGLLTTTGGIINYARNVSFDEESNLTFGLNIAAYKSGINTSKIITNTVDPLLSTFANSTILAINPGINYGSGQIDFGLSANNLVLYNFSDSKTIANDPEKSFQGHFMYTGFVESNGFLDEGKFTTLLRAENKKAKTVFAGILAFELPTIGWLQAGYNNLNGVSGGLGFNIARNFSIGYNYEKTLGDAATLGISHEFMLAYVFKDSDNNDSGVVYVKPAATPDKPKVNLTAKQIADAKAKAAADALAAKSEADRLLKEKSAADAKLLADTKAKATADAAAAKIEADRLLKEKTANNAKLLADAKAKAAADALAAKAEADRLLKEKGLSGAKAIADAKAKAAADAAKAKAETDRLLKEKEANNTKGLADAKAKAAADALAAKAEADRLLKEKAAATKAKNTIAPKPKSNDNTANDAKAKADAAKAKLEADKAKAEADKIIKNQENAAAKAKADAAAKAKIESDKAKAEADKIIKDQENAAAKAKADADKLAKDQAAADAKIKVDAAAKAKAETDKIKADAAAEGIIKADEAAKAKAEADKIIKDKALADAKAKADADKLAKGQAAADAKIKADAAAKAKAEADKIKADAAAEAKLKADETAKAKADADKIIKDKAIADAKAKAEADKLAKDQASADAKIKADAAAKAKAEADKIKADAAAEAKLKADEAAKTKAEADKIIKDKALADAKAKADADKLAKDQAAADAKIKADAAAKAKAEADKIKADAAAEAKLKADEAAKAKAEADKIIKDKALADAKAKADADKIAKEQAVIDAKIKADAAAKAKLEADKLAKEKAITDAKAKADAAAKSKIEADKAEADAKVKAESQKGDDEKSMDYINKILKDNGKNNKQLISRLDSTVVAKQKDLKDLKEENDLGDKGVFKEPKPFQSASIANRLIESLKADLAESTNTQNQFVSQLEELVNERLKRIPSRTDPINLKYLTEIDRLKAEQAKNELLKSNLISSLERIKAETDIEKKRRIKRAAFENGQGRFEQDRASLKRIKETTAPSRVALTPADFDFGLEDQSNMQILKKIDNTQNGYYLILAVHSDITKRDAFIAKVVSSGQQTIDFFYDISSSKYFIYTKKYESLDEISTALDNKGNKPYNGKMFVVKIEN